VLALLLLLTLPARAAAQGPRLLPPVDPEGAGAAGLLPPPWPAQYLIGAGATVVAVPAGLLLGSLLGTLSNNLVLAALPGLVLFAVLPPLAVTLAEWLVGNHWAPGTAAFQPALWVAVGVHLAAMVVAIGLGVSSQSLTAVCLFTLAEALLLPGAVTLTMRLTGRTATAPPRASTPGLPPALSGQLAALAPGQTLVRPALLLPVFALAF
jgi:hypothetical protein